MPFKDYTNPLYDVVEDESDWLNGLCCIFANALVERFSLPLKALVVRSKGDGCETLVHAFASLPEGRIVDARGIRREQQLLDEDYVDVSEREWRSLHCARPDEDIEICIVPVTVGNLWALNPEDLDATNAAHAHIEQHPERFGELIAA
jgi:hypothetical protein